MMFGFQFSLIVFFLVSVIGLIVIVLRITIMGMCKGFTNFSFIHFDFFLFCCFSFSSVSTSSLCFGDFSLNNHCAGNEQRINQQTKWLPTNNDYGIGKNGIEQNRFTFFTVTLVIKKTGKFFLVSNQLLSFFPIALECTRFNWSKHFQLFPRSFLN